MYFICKAIIFNKEYGLSSCNWYNSHISPHLVTNWSGHFEQFICVHKHQSHFPCKNIDGRKVRSKSGHCQGILEYRIHSSSFYCTLTEWWSFISYNWPLLVHNLGRERTRTLLVVSNSWLFLENSTPCGSRSQLGSLQWFQVWIPYFDTYLGRIKTLKKT